MLDKKQRLYRLLETYINDFRGDAVQEMYGKGTKVKIHNINFSTTSKSIFIESIIILGETINESVIDTKLLDVLIQDAMVYFYPEASLRTYVRFDV
jgi:hypothetical protein